MRASVTFEEGQPEWLKRRAEKLGPDVTVSEVVRRLVADAMERERLAALPIPAALQVQVREAEASVLSCVSKAVEELVAVEMARRLASGPAEPAADRPE
jgi:hypothetical protein